MALPNLKDLQWALQAINSHTLDLHSLSFILSSQTAAMGCFQQTKTSMNVNISNGGLTQFSQLLKALACNAAQPSLRNVEFHLIEWDVQLMKDLRVMIENNPSIKQLMFRRNKFPAGCLAELSDALRKNEHVKEIMLSESGIGSEGAAALASALKDNHCSKAADDLRLKVHHSNAADFGCFG